MTIKLLTAAAFAISFAMGAPAFAQTSNTDMNQPTPMNCGTPGADNVNCQKQDTDMSTTGSVKSPNTMMMDNKAAEPKKDNCGTPGADNVNCQK
ncbi:hypothetical protein [Pararhizobium arenae]|uniref:hypothetical protein n=1 Tax=Pararhizobium arenae TaxID=1856850 RepID=UPI00094B350A|nr:hypothetical protein [Pararhizobium arenae]